MDKLAIYRHQGLGGTSGIGRQCALILVDFVNGFVDVDQLGGRTFRPQQTRRSLCWLIFGRRVCRSFIRVSCFQAMVRT
jgi:hypothetical protein